MILVQPCVCLIDDMMHQLLLAIFVEHRNRETVSSSSSGQIKTHGMSISYSSYLFFQVTFEKHGR